MRLKNGSGRIYWEPMIGQNIIDKVNNMKIFVPVLAFKRRSEVCFYMFHVNKYFLYFIHLTFCADKKSSP